MPYTPQWVDRGASSARTDILEQLFNPSTPLHLTITFILLKSYICLTSIYILLVSPYSCLTITLKSLIFLCLTLTLILLRFLIIRLTSTYTLLHSPHTVLVQKPCPSFTLPTQRNTDSQLQAPFRQPVSSCIYGRGAGLASEVM